MKSSIEIHLEKCGDKFIAESEQYGIKRKVPVRPAELDDLLAQASLS
jgi:hypothetical protein